MYGHRDGRVFLCFLLLLLHLGAFAMRISTAWDGWPRSFFFIYFWFDFDSSSIEIKADFVWVNRIDAYCVQRRTGNMSLMPFDSNPTVSHLYVDRRWMRSRFHDGSSHIVRNSADRMKIIKFVFAMCGHVQFTIHWTNNRPLRWAEPRR